MNPVDSVGWWDLGGVVYQWYFIDTNCHLSQLLPKFLGSVLFEASFYVNVRNIRLCCNLATKESYFDFQLISPMTIGMRDFLRQSEKLFVFFLWLKDFMLDSAIFLLKHFPCRYEQLIYLTLLVFLCSSYTASETATYFIIVVPLISSSFQATIGGNWSICFIAGDHDLPILNSFWQAGSYFF